MPGAAVRTNIAKVTSGRVKCNILPKATVAAPQTFDAIANGLIDQSFQLRTAIRRDASRSPRRPKFPLHGRHG